MEQKDYILREIEKIGQIIIAIRQKLFGGREDGSSVRIETEATILNNELLNELNFDLEKFLQFDAEESHDYLSQFEAFSVENIELLAELLSQIGFSEKFSQSRKYLEKALQLFELLNMETKTFSFDREAKIQAIKRVL